MLSSYYDGELRPVRQTEEHVEGDQIDQLMIFSSSLKYSEIKQNVDWLRMIKIKSKYDT